MKLIDHFVSKHALSQVPAGMYDRFDAVRHDGKVWFYSLPMNTNAEDFADAVSVAFEVDVDPRDVSLTGDVYFVDVA